jgi:uncharacterized protein (TIGR02145 family)
MWSNLTNGGSNPAYTGVNASTLSMSNVPLSYNNYEYRCIVSHYCCPEATSDAAILSVLTPALSVTDIEGNTYNTVAIGSQLWMAENLKTVHYNDNTPISLVIDGAATPGFCWYNNNEATYKSIYGALYNWYAINTSKLCPSGWHVPTSAEWFTLYNYLTNNGFGFEGNGYDVAKCLAATSGWTSSTLAGTPGNDQANNNSSGFTALPSGFRQNASFFYAGTGAYWWSITGSDGTSAYFRSIYYGDIYFNFSIFDKKDGLSVRCVKD